MQFKKATRQAVKLKLAISGPSGSGKTWGALELAKGLGGKAAFIDTENESASLYADRFEFDHLCLSAPFTTQKFSEAIDAAVSARYDVLIIDSISHEWAAEGGILDQKTQLDVRGAAAGGKNNQFTNWAKPSAEHEKFKAKILQCPLHVIATMRSKTEYDISSGKPQKIGLAPVQRDGMEYEFSVVFDVAINHEALASKDRTALFDQRHFRLTPAIGQELKAWLGKGGDPNPFKSDQEFSNDSAEQKQHTREAMFRLATFPSGTLKGQFLESANVETLNKLVAHIAKAQNVTTKDELLSAAAQWWISEKSKDAVSTP